MAPRHLDDAAEPTMTTTTTISVPTSCAALCTTLAELTRRIDDEIDQASSGAAIDYGGLEQRVADALGEVERGRLGVRPAANANHAPTTIGAVSPRRGSTSQYENHTLREGCGSNTVTS